MGGVVVHERIGGKSVRFVSWKDAKYYVAQNTGRMYDVSVPPPSACDTCGAMHWFWECMGSQ